MEDDRRPKKNSLGESRKQASVPPPRRRIPLWTLLIVGVLVAAGAYGAYVYLTPRPHCTGTNSIVVDTYDSFMGSGSNPNATRAAVFQGFENATHSCVTVNYLTQDVANAIQTEPSSQLPDIALGLNEVTAEALGLEGYLLPYTPPGLSEVNSTLVNELSPEHYASPYEWQYLGLDYMTSVDNRTAHAISTGDVFDTLLQNRSLAQSFLYENPTTDPVGKEFLLWEYQFYTSVLHQNWTSFWKSTQNVLPPAVNEWSTGIGEFGPSGYPLFVSFGTDPSYYATFPSNFSMNTTFSHYGGKQYAWKSIYGAAIVKGGIHNQALDEEFLNWLLSPGVQSEIPLNEWMYPANSSVPIPSVFAANPSVTGVIALNGYTSPRAIAGNLTGLLEEWQSVA